jgi:peroxiredoxin
LSEVVRTDTANFAFFSFFFGILDDPKVLPMKIKMLAVFLLLSCNGFTQSNSFRINGTVAHDFNGYLYLSYGKRTDSVLVTARKFTFEGRVDYPIEARVHTRNGPSADDLFLENSIMEVKLTIRDNATYITNLQGNQTAMLLTELEEFYASIESHPEFATKLYHKLDSIFTNNPTNQFCGSLLSDVIMDPVFSFEQAYSLYTRLDTTLITKETAYSIHASLKRLKNIRIGTTMIPFELPDATGKLIRVSDLRQKIVLVEFWASWCTPCRATNPSLKKLYANFQRKGFEIYGISIDRDSNAWKQAVKEDGLPWINTFAKGEWKNPVIKSLGIQYLPSNYLIDRNGSILAINIKPEELEKKIEQLLQN